MKPIVAQALINDAIDDERRNQETLRKERGWGPLADEDYHILNTVLSEEVGETAKAMLDLLRVPRNDKQAKILRLEELKAEAIQTAAVAAQIAEKATMELFDLSLTA